jgi:hypothetical protein
MLCFDTVEHARDYVLWWDGYYAGFSDGSRKNRGNGMQEMEAYNQGWSDGWLMGGDWN